MHVWDMMTSAAWQHFSVSMYVSSIWLSKLHRIQFWPGKFLALVHCLMAYEKINPARGQQSFRVLLVLHYFVMRSAKVCEKGMPHSELGYYMVSSVLAPKVEPSLLWVTFDMQGRKVDMCTTSRSICCITGCMGREHDQLQAGAMAELDGHTHDGSDMHCIALHCIALHCIALHCIALHCIALHCIALHCIALHCIALHCIALHCIVFALHGIALHLSYGPILSRDINQRAAKA